MAMLFGRRGGIPGVVPYLPDQQAAKPRDQYDPLGQGQQRRPGLFGRLGNALRRVDWERVGAAMRDDPAILQSLTEQRQSRRLLDFRIRGEKTEEGNAAAAREAAAAARKAAIAALPPEQQVFARADLGPFVAAQAPMSAEDRARQDFQERQFGETVRHNRASESIDAQRARQAATQQSLDQDTLDMLAGPVALGANLPVGMSRSPGMARQIYARAAQLRQERGLSPETYAQAQAAYRGNQQAVGQLSSQRARIGVAEQTALRNLQLAQELSARVPRTNVPLINRALLEGRAHIQGDPDTVAFYNALQTAREEYAKVLSGNTSATGITDASRAEAARLIRPDMTPEQIDAAIQTATIEMGNRMSAFDDMMSGLGDAIGNGQMVPTDQNHAPPPAASRTPRQSSNRTPQRPASIPQSEWNAMTASERQRVSELMQ